MIKFMLYQSPLFGGFPFIWDEYKDYEFRLRRFDGKRFKDENDNWMEYLREQQNPKQKTKLDII